MSKKTKIQDIISRLICGRASLIFISLVFIFCVASLIGVRSEVVDRIWTVHKIKSQNEFNERRVVLNNDSDQSISGTLDDSLVMHDSEGNPLYLMCSLVECPFLYDFKDKEDIDKISIAFVGSPRIKEDVIFSFKEKSVKDKEYIEDCNSDRSLCDYYFLNSKENQGKFSINLRSATFKPYGIREIKFFEAKEKGAFESIFDFVFVWDRGMFIYFVYPILFFVILMIPGLLFGEFLKKIKRKELNFLQVILSSVVIFFGLFVILDWFSTGVFKFFVVLGLIISSFFVTKKNSFSRNFLSENKVSILIYLISILFLSFLMLFRDYPFSGSIELNDFITKSNFSISYGTYETDFLIPYESALNFQEGGKALNRKIGGIYDITDRTLMISFLFLVYGKIFGSFPFVYQMFIIVLANLFIFAFLQVSNLFFGKEKGYLIATVFAFSNFFTFTTLFGPAKTVTLFFILGSAFYLLRENRSYLMAGVFMAAAYLFHPFALVYFLSFGMFVFVELVVKFFKKDKKLLLKELAKFIVPVIFVFALWSGYSAYLGDHGTIYSSVISGDTWSNASKGIDNDESGISPSLVLEKNFWMNKFYNGVGLFCFSCVDFPEDRHLDFYRATIPGAIGVVVSVLTIAGLVKCLFLRKLKKDETQLMDRIVTYFVFFPLVFTLLYQGFFVQLGIMWYVLGVIPFIFMIFLMLYNKWLLRLAVLVILIENFYLLFIYDKLNSGRISSFFGKEENVLVFVLMGIISIYLILNRIIQNENRKNC